MYIAKPHKGFVIPVEYMVNENLFDDNVKYLRNEQKHIVNEYDNTENNSVFLGTEKIVPRDVQVLDDVVNDRLFDDDEIYSSKDGNNVITTVLEERNHKIENSSGILVFDDVSEEDIVIDYNKSIELDKARSNLRKAIEVEIEKIGKLVLDDAEAEISTKVGVKSADVEVDDKTGESEDNIGNDDRVTNGSNITIEEVSSGNTVENKSAES